MTNSTCINIRPILNGRTGKPLNDIEFVDFALNEIDSYSKDNSTAVPVLPKFIEWLREAKEAINRGESLQEFKKKTVNRAMGEYADVIRRTIEREQKKGDKRK